METRRLGRTGQACSVIAFGSFALLQASQDETDADIRFRPLSEQVESEIKKG